MDAMSLRSCRVVGHTVMWMESLYLNNEERIGKQLWARTVGEFLIMEIVQRLSRQELKIIRNYKTGRDPSCHLNQSFPTRGQSAQVDCEWLTDEPQYWSPHSSGQLSRTSPSYGASCCDSF